MVLLLRRPLAAAAAALAQNKQSSHRLEATTLTVRACFALMLAPTCARFLFLSPSLRANGWLRKGIALQTMANVIGAHAGADSDDALSLSLQVCIMFLFILLTFYLSLFILLTPRRLRRRPFPVTAGVHHISILYIICHM